MERAAPPGRAGVLVIEGAGHAAHLAAPDVVRAAILDHLAAPAVASPGAMHGRTP
jgi:pimeloyl-ACP methyl ester carboxylesterase